MKTYICHVEYPAEHYFNDNYEDIIRDKVGYSSYSGMDFDNGPRMRDLGFVRKTKVQAEGVARKIRGLKLRGVRVAVKANN